MTLTQLLNRPCVITRRTEGTTKNAYGDEIPAVATIETVCELQQRQRSEDSNQGEVSDTGWALFLPYNTTIGTGDIVTVDGATYEVDGEPWNARNPLRGGGHVEASLRRTTGPGDQRETT